MIICHFCWILVLSMQYIRATGAWCLLLTWARHAIVKLLDKASVFKCKSEWHLSDALLRNKTRRCNKLSGDHGWQTAFKDRLRSNKLPKKRKWMSQNLSLPGSSESGVWWRVWVAKQELFLSLLDAWRGKSTFLLNFFFWFA